VARLLQRHRLPGLYRTHEEPDPEELKGFGEFVRALLQRRIDPLDRRQLQDLLLEVSGTPLAATVNMALLRCMKRATYQAEPRPHFALNFPLYCHFTSPIRRYPDLLERRRAELRSPRWSREALAAVAEHCTQAEQRADAAERELVKLKLLRFLQQRAERGEIFDAVITGVEQFGVFAQLREFSVEGLIRTATLKGDSYHLDAQGRALVGRRTGHVLRLGQSIEVLIKRIDLQRRQLDLVLKQ